MERQLPEDLKDYGRELTDPFALIPPGVASKLLIAGLVAAWFADRLGWFA